jgi:hypothetical protein
MQNNPGDAACRAVQKEGEEKDGAVHDRANIIVALFFDFFDVKLIPAGKKSIPINSLRKRSSLRIHPIIRLVTFYTHPKSSQYLPEEEETCGPETSSRS